MPLQIQANIESICAGIKPLSFNVSLNYQLKVQAISITAIKYLINLKLLYLFFSFKDDYTFKLFITFYIFFFMLKIKYESKHIHLRSDQP